MLKVTLMGAGSVVFTKNIVGDIFLTPELRQCHISLYDIDKDRLSGARKMVKSLNHNLNKDRAKVTAHLGPAQRKAALKDADFVVNMVQVGGYQPSTVIDFEIPKKYGLRQTIADTLGIGGIFRALRTIPVVLDFTAEMEKVCPSAWFLNYVNPMAMITGALNRGSNIQTIGLCHSVQHCVPSLFKLLDMPHEGRNLKSLIAGINHMAWLLEISEDGKDLYPEIKKRAAKLNRDAMKKGAQKHGDMIRLEMMRNFGHYITESSEHNAEYSPLWIKHNYPEMIEKWNIPLDEYPRRCVEIIKIWKDTKKELIDNKKLKHKLSHEYCSRIIKGFVTDNPFQFGGNVVNDGYITNLPRKAIVEVPCFAQRNGIRPTVVGDLPEQCAALNRTNINVQLLTLEAYFNNSKDALYQAALLDPHTAAELNIEDIRKMCDEMIKAHGKYLPKLK